MPSNTLSDSFESLFGDVSENQHETSRFYLPDTELGKNFLKNLTYANVVSTCFEGNVVPAKISDMKCSSLSQIQVLSAILSSYELLNQLSKRFNRTAETLVFPVAVYQFRRQYDDVIPHRTFEDDGTKHWYGEAITKKSD